MNRTIFPVILLLVWTGRSQAQDSFQNLDFESAQIVFEGNPYNFAFIATTNALPGWTAFSGANQLSTIPYGIGAYIPSVSLVSQTNFGSIDGFFSVVLGGGSISQSALVPGDAQTLLFKIAAGNFGGPVTVSLDSQELSYIAVSNGSNYTLYGADISRFAGQSSTLRFVGSQTMLDDIQFSPTAVPEPSWISLTGIVGGLLFYVRVRKRSGS